LGAVLTSDTRLLEVLRRHSTVELAAARVGWCCTPEWLQADADVQAAWAQAAQQGSVVTFEMVRALRPQRVRRGAALSERLLALLDEGIAIDGARHAADLVATAHARCPWACNWRALGGVTTRCWPWPRLACSGLS